MNNAGQPAAPALFGQRGQQPLWSFVIPACLWLWSQFNSIGPKSYSIRFVSQSRSQDSKDSPQLPCFTCTGALICNILSDWQTLGRMSYKLVQLIAYVSGTPWYDRLPHCMPTCSSYNNNNIMLKLIYSAYNACT